MNVIFSLSTFDDQDASSYFLRCDDLIDLHVQRNFLSNEIRNWKGLPLFTHLDQ